MFALFEPYHADYCIYTCNSIRNNFVQDRNGMVISYSIGYFGQPIWSSVLYIPSIGLPNAFVGPGPRTRPLLGFVGQDLAEPEVGGTCIYGEYNYSCCT